MRESNCYIIANVSNIFLTEREIYLVGNNTDNKIELSVVRQIK